MAARVRAGAASCGCGRRHRPPACRRRNPRGPGRPATAWPRGRRGCAYQPADRGARSRRTRRCCASGAMRGARCRASPGESGGELGAALAAARCEDGAACAGAHAQPEAVRLGPAPVVRLEGPLAHLYVSTLAPAGGPVRAGTLALDRAVHRAQGTPLLPAVKPRYGTSAPGPGSNQGLVHCLWTTPVEREHPSQVVTAAALGPRQARGRAPVATEFPTCTAGSGPAPPPELASGVRTSTLSGRSGERRAEGRHAPGISVQVRGG